jgi:hypothetical protein
MQRLIITYDVYRLLKSGSEWADYLQSLPQKTVPIALLWDYNYEDNSVPDTDGNTSGTEFEWLFKNKETGEHLLVSCSLVMRVFQLRAATRRKFPDSMRRWCPRYYHTTASA